MHPRTYPTSCAWAAEFVQLLSSEALEVATKEKKSTIQPEHVMAALTELGFSEFVEAVTQAWEQHKEEAKSEQGCLQAAATIDAVLRGSVTEIFLHALACTATNTHKAALRKTGADQAGYTEEQQVKGGSWLDVLRLRGMGRHLAEGVVPGWTFLDARHEGKGRHLAEGGGIQLGILS